MAPTFLTLQGNVKMPTIGIGTWEARDDNEIEATLDTALETGYRHIDTAHLYGNEALIGKVLKKWMDSGKLKREDLFITTKLPLAGVHPERVEFFMKKSLKLLQLDYVDLYLVHFPVGQKYDMVQDRLIVDGKGDPVSEGPTDHEGIWKKMEEQVDAGRTRLIGLSNYTIPQINRVLKVARIKPANLQIEVHVYCQQKQLVQHCRKHDISIVAYSPLASPGINKFLKRLNYEEHVLPDILNDALVAQLTKKYNKTPAQIVLRFLIQENFVPIPKSVTPKRIKENFDVYDFQISNEDMEALRKLDQGDKAKVCDFTGLKNVSQHPDFPLK